MRRMFFNTSISLITLLCTIVSSSAFVQRDASLRLKLGQALVQRGGAQITEPHQVIGRGPMVPVLPFVPSLLEGRNALVTGGNRGIGEAITVALVKAGAKVWVMANSKQAFRDMVKRHGLDDSDGTGNVHWVQADLRVPSEAIAGAKKAVEGAGGTIDLLVNNAGVAMIEDFMDASVESFDKLIAVNTRAPLLVSQVCLEGMIKQRYGKIVNITSMAAVISAKGFTTYSTSKAAMNGLLNGLVCDLSQHNIQVNNIAPTIVWTDMALEVWKDPASTKAMLDNTPMGRFAEPWEIANMVVFLCSDGCTMCVGQTICVDGGFTCL